MNATLGDTCLVADVKVCDVLLPSKVMSMHCAQLDHYMQLMHIRQQTRHYSKPWLKTHWGLAGGQAVSCKLESLSSVTGNSASLYCNAAQNWTASRDQAIGA